MVEKVGIVDVVVVVGIVDVVAVGAVVAVGIVVVAVVVCVDVGGATGGPTGDVVVIVVVWSSVDVVVVVWLSSKGSGKVVDGMVMFVLVVYSCSVGDVVVMMMMGECDEVNDG